MAISFLLAVLFCTNYISWTRGGGYNTDEYAYPRNQDNKIVRDNQQESTQFFHPLSIDPEMLPLSLFPTSNKRIRPKYSSSNSDGSSSGSSSSSSMDAFPEESSFNWIDNTESLSPSNTRYSSLTRDPDDLWNYDPSFQNNKVTSKEMEDRKDIRLSSQHEKSASVSHSSNIDPSMLPLSSFRLPTKQSTSSDSSLNSHEFTNSASSHDNDDLSLTGSMDSLPLFYPMHSTYTEHDSSNYASSHENDDLTRMDSLDSSTSLHTSSSLSNTYKFPHHDSALSMTDLTKSSSSSSSTTGSYYAPDHPFIDQTKNPFSILYFDDYMKTKTNGLTKKLLPMESPEKATPTSTDFDIAEINASTAEAKKRSNYFRGENTNELGLQKK